MNSKNIKTLKLLLLFSGFFLTTTILFNNCTSGFQTNDLSGSQQESHSTNPADPPPSVPAVPLQPAPAQVQPIVTTDNPSWMAGKSLNEWIEIPNTSGAGGAALFAFSGIALREANSELIVGAAGGHSDSSDNRVVSLVLETNNPAWVLRIPQSPLPTIDVPHYADGTPTSRHTYQTTFYVESLNRLFLFGVRGAFGNAYHFKNVDAFSFESNQWDPPNTWAPLPIGSGFGAVKISGSDDVFTSSLHKWSASSAVLARTSGNMASTEVWSLPVTTRTDTPIRWPVAYDKSRNQLFNLQFGDGFGYELPVANASRINLNTGVQTKINFKASSTYDLFLKEKPSYAAMDYDPENDQYLFYSGMGEAAGRIYVIKPLTGDEWDISLFATTANSLRPAASPGSGINSNFKYVPRLKGFVLLPTKTSNVLFLKTAQ